MGFIQDAIKVFKKTEIAFIESRKETDFAKDSFFGIK